jgi:putative endonuclease
MLFYRMAKHNETGAYGEQLAVDYFIKAGYIILEKNWRYKKWEVDIIAHKNDLLHFIEVKSRTSRQFGHPEESVHAKKIKHLIDASAEYLYLHPQWQRIQFDVLSIMLHKEKEPDYFLIEDVYE